MPGIQSIRNCPGLALLQAWSMKLKVLTVGLSVRIWTIWVVLIWLFAVSEADNFFYTPIMFLSQISVYSSGYCLENLCVVADGCADLHC